MEAYITAVEEASSKLPSMEADELRSDVSHLLRQHNIYHNNQINLSPIQHRALTQLKQDSSRVVLTADNGVVMVIMDQQDYTNKAQALLDDTNTYKIINKDPTNRLKNKLIQTYIIYHYKCPHLNCPELYIRETGRGIGSVNILRLLPLSTLTATIQDIHWTLTVST